MEMSAGAALWLASSERPLWNAGAREPPEGRPEHSNSALGKAQLSEYRKEWLGYAEKITSIFEGGKKDE